jgi:hypothetical protein
MKKGDSKKRNRKKYQDLEGVALPSSLSHGGAGLDPFHRYAEPPTKPREAWVYGGGGARGLSCARGPYVVSFASFYEWGFGMPPHWFLCSLLQYHGLELHHITPSGVLHIVAFVTLCEAYLGIDPELDLWKYFFRVRRR